jgi:L-serine dehydratase
MHVSVFDLFKLGVGPSSSHTMGPMTAAGRFLERLGPDLERTARVETTLYASLALTGRGHATDRAVILGLAGFAPRTDRKSVV